MSWPKHNPLLSFANILPTFLSIKTPFCTASGRVLLVAGWDVAQWFTAAVGELSWVVAPAKEWLAAHWTRWTPGRPGSHWGLPAFNGCFQKKAVFDSVDWVKQMVLTNISRHCPICWGLHRTKGGGRETWPLLELHIHLLPLDFGTLGSRAFGLDLHHWLSDS